MCQGIITTADAPPPVGLDKENIVGGDGSGTAQLIHAPGHADSVRAISEGKGGRGGGDKEE